MFDCIVPAAGASTRMRPAEGRAVKQLLPFGEGTLVEASVGMALDAGCRVLLVVGHRGDEVAALFEAARGGGEGRAGRIVVVQNPRWEEGLLGSIQSALPLVEGEAFFVALADMPFVGEPSFRALAAAWAARKRAGQPGAAIFAAHGGKRGHPVLLPSAWMGEMQRQDPAGAMRDFLADRPTVLVETGPGALRDIDTPGDYESALMGH
jgi:molybdenum cofactor cytidylyltransferase